MLPLRNLLVGFSIATLLLGGGALAATKAGRQSVPAFSPADRQVIARNSLLAQTVNGDPWLVRRILDEIARGAAAPPASLAPSEAATNPDLAPAGRSSSEASYDLFQLLKRAAAEKPRK